MKEKTLSVTAICDGTVIDHIRKGQGLRILRLLKLTDDQQQMTLGLNLKSSSMGFKDLIKIESIHLTEAQTAQVALFSPDATVNVIRNYQVIEKYKVHLPKNIEGVLPCPNPLCITNSERVNTRFVVVEANGKVRLRCSFCEKIHTREENPG